MRKVKGNSIFLYKEHPTQADSRDIKTSRSRSHHKDGLSQNNKNSRINPVEYTLPTCSTSRPLNMEDYQARIKRDYSPLYQRSTQQSQLFEKGLKKPSKNINLESRINLSQKSLSPLNSKTLDLSPRVIKRQDPNKQVDNILELGAKPLLSSRLNTKRDPNVQSGFKQTRRQKSQVKDKNVQTTQTADYVVKALSTHVANNVKEVHLKFNKKQNVLNKQNLPQQFNQTSQQPIVKEHKRHFSHLAYYPNKQNIEVRQNGLCLKQTYDQKSKHARKLFNHDFYKKQARINNVNKQNALKEKSHYQQFNAVKTARCQPGSKTHLKTEYQSGAQCLSRVGQLRKRFL